VRFCRRVSRLLPNDSRMSGDRFGSDELCRGHGSTKVYINSSQLPFQHITASKITNCTAIASLPISEMRHSSPHHRIQRTSLPPAHDRVLCATIVGCTGPFGKPTFDALNHNFEEVMRRFETVCETVEPRRQCPPWSPDEARRPFRKISAIGCEVSTSCSRLVGIGREEKNVWDCRAAKRPEQCAPR